MTNRKNMNSTNAAKHTEKAFDPVDFHRVNITRMSDGAVAVPSYPGAGAALLGNIFLEIGLNYLDPYTEELKPDGTSVPIFERINYRARLAAMYKNDQTSNSSHLSKTIYCKTHLYAHEFNNLNLGGVILLIRDPRDTIYSYYNWRLGFSEEGEKGTFIDFLKRKSVLGYYPLNDWVEFYKSWIKTREKQGKFTVIRFEDIKVAPEKTVRQVLEAMNIKQHHLNISQAIERSSFEQMRRHEDSIVNSSSQIRIMRRGKVNEWKEWYDERFAKIFHMSELVELAGSFGYEI